MRRLLPLSILCLIVLAGCDESPTSVEDFEIQPDLSVSTSSVSFTLGERPSPTFDVTYQGLDRSPEVTASSGFAFEKVEESGSPEDGRQTWAVRFEGEVPSAGMVEDSIVVRTTGGGREITETIQVQVSSPVTIAESFTSPFAAVADYEDEQRAVTTTGGTSVEVVTDEVASGSNGLNALRVNASGSGAVTFERTTNARDANVFSFLIKPASSTDFTATVTFTDQTEAGTQDYTVDVPVAAGNAWRKVSIATQQLFEDFEPVAERAGGDGALLSVSMTADQNVTYHVDELAFGTTEAPHIEINDFEQTTGAYMAGAFTASSTDQVAEVSDGPTALDLSWSGGDSFFGYNYDGLSVDATSEGVLRMIVGRASKAFNLFVFVETAGGTYGYGTGQEVAIETGEDFREIEVPLSSLGGDVAALRSEGVTNVGFEVRRQESDDTSDPIQFILDGVKLQASGTAD